MQIKYRFPAFRKQNIVYLDNGATTQIPDAVERGVEQALELRGNPGRSSHQLARKSAELLEEAREAVGFVNIKQIKLKSDSHFTAWIAQKK